MSLAEDVKAYVLRVFSDKAHSRVMFFIFSHFLSPIVLYVYTIIQRIFLLSSFDKDYYYYKVAADSFLESKSLSFPQRVILYTDDSLARCKTKRKDAARKIRTRLCECGLNIET